MKEGVVVDGWGVVLVCDGGCRSVPDEKNSKVELKRWSKKPIKENINNNNTNNNTSNKLEQRKVR